MMGGSINVISELGYGSMFMVKLPATVSEPIKQSTEELLSKGDGIVLVIDDDRVVRSLFKQHLTHLGYAVAVAAGGSEGLRLAQKLRPDAIILDVKMPGIDGWKVLATLKSDLLLNDIPVIMISVEEAQGMARGATDYLLKPVRQEQIKNLFTKYRIGDQSQNLVMIVEDDMVIREVLAGMFKKEGWRVFKAENGQVALEQLQNKKPSLILLDLMMPVMDGFEFLTQMRNHEKWRSIPVVVLTSTHLDPEEQARLQGDVETIFQKESYQQEDLLKHIHQLISDSKKLGTEVVQWD
jgi:CheY-like chemotaxis protein